jgi:hypothetical protein
MWLQSKSIFTHTPYLGLYNCLPHPNTVLIIPPPPHNEQENVDRIEGETI